MCIARNHTNNVCIAARLLNRHIARLLNNVHANNVCIARVLNSVHTNNVCITRVLNGVHRTITQQGASHDCERLLKSVRTNNACIARLLNSVHPTSLATLWHGCRITILYTSDAGLFFNFGVDCEGYLLWVCFAGLFFNLGVDCVGYLLWVCFVGLFCTRCPTQQIKRRGTCDRVRAGASKEYAEHLRREQELARNNQTRPRKLRTRMVHTKNETTRDKHKKQRQKTLQAEMPDFKPSFKPRCGRQKNEFCL